MLQNNLTAEVYRNLMMDDLEDLVWKVKLPIEAKDSKFDKWPPNWEGPYRIKRCVPGNAYILETLGGEEEFGRAINEKYLKKYYPSVWINT